jgi:hypothetical protein
MPCKCAVFVFLSVCRKAVSPPVCLFGSVSHSLALTIGVARRAPTGSRLRRAGSPTNLMSSQIAVSGRSCQAAGVPRRLAGRESQSARQRHRRRAPTPEPGRRLPGRRAARPTPAGQNPGDDTAPATPPRARIRRLPGRAASAALSRPNRWDWHPAWPAMARPARPPNSTAYPRDCGSPAGRDPRTSLSSIPGVSRRRLARSLVAEARVKQRTGRFDDATMKGGRQSSPTEGE